MKESPPCDNVSSSSFWILEEFGDGESEMFDDLFRFSFTEVGLAVADNMMSLLYNCCMFWGSYLVILLYIVNWVFLIFEEDGIY